MAAVLPVTRSQVLAFRTEASGLHRSEADALALPPLELGIQDTPPGSARLALAARLGRPPTDERLTLAWSVRGAPHLHRPKDLPALAAALWPLSDADATARIGTNQIAAGKRLGIAAFTAAAAAMRDVVRAPMPKGEVSRAVSEDVPDVLTYDCAACAARHISGGLFQQVGLPAGTSLLREGRHLLVTPAQDWPLPVPPEPSGADSLVTAYLRLLGPATPADTAAFLGTTARAARPAWPGGLQEVEVDGRPAWLPADSVAALTGAPPAPDVRLLPPADPFLQARDRALLVPDRARQRAIWRAVSSPGALLVRGEVAGTWRATAGSRERLDVTVTPFEPLVPTAMAGLDVEADLLARTRGAVEARIVLA